MSKKALFWLLICIPLVLIASGCKPVCTPAEYEGFKVFPSSPFDGTIVSSLSPTFEWHSNEECQPGHINLEITKDALGPGTIYTTGGLETSYTLTTPLDPASKYIWKPYASSTGDDIGKILNWYWAFFTGPICTSGVPEPPVLDVPSNGGYAEPLAATSGFHFHWHYPGDCLPTSYLYEFASDPNFQDIVLSGETADYKSYLMYQMFPDCSTLYWRVAAKIGSQVGPWSDPAIFYYVYDNKCWQNHYLSDDVALIRGKVYRDQCTQTFQTLPNGASAYGCIDHAFGIMGDGNMSYNENIDYGEPGLANVVVDLGAGPCPSTGLDQTTTGAKGKYSFTVLTPGEYCVSVNKNQTGYSGGTTYNMMNGLWSELPTKALSTGYDLYLSPGWYNLNLNFGWDKYDSFIKPFFREPTWCRWRPYPICDPLHLFEVGDVAPMLARNEAGTWFMTSIQGETCYFYNQYTKEAEITEADVGMPVEEYLKKFNELEVYPDPAPCPPPPPPPKPKQDKEKDVDFSKYASQDPCLAAGCNWLFGAAAGKCY